MTLAAGPAIWNEAAWNGGRSVGDTIGQAIAQLVVYMPTDDIDPESAGSDAI